MIIYLTKETFERYKLKMPEEFTNTLAGSVADIILQKETGDRLMEWGGKLFYFDRRKCLQLVNFASKLTFVLVDVKMKDGWQELSKLQILLIFSTVMDLSKS